jgi:hypothetical protein
MTVGSAKSMFLAYCQRALGVAFCLAVCGTAFVYAVSTLSDLTANIRRDVYYHLYYAQSYGIFIKLTYIFCTLPFAANYVLETNTRYKKFVLIRSGKRNYAGVHASVCAIFGGLSLSLGVALYYFVLLGSGNPFFDATISRSFTSGYDSLLISGNVSGYFLSMIYLEFLRGALWSTIGLCVSSYIRTFYVAVFAPIVLSYAYIELAKFMKISDLFRLDRLLSIRYPLDAPFVSIFIATAVTAVLLFAFAFIFRKKFERDIEND